MQRNISRKEFNIESFSFWILIMSIFSVMTNNIIIVLITIPISIILCLFLIFKKNNRIIINICFSKIIILIILLGISLIISNNFINSKLFYFKLIYTTIISIIISNLINKKFKYYMTQLFHVITYIHILSIIFFRNNVIYVYQGSNVFGIPGFDKNGTAMLLSFSILFFISDIKEEFYEKKKMKFINILMVIANTFMIFMTKSGSGLIILLLAMIILISNKRFLFKMMKYLPIIVIVILTLYIISYEYLLNSRIDYIFHKYLDKSIALSGRINIWKFSLEMFLKKPLLGYGYYGLWANNKYILQNMIEMGYSFSGFKAHCGYLAILLDGGIIGAILIINIIIKYLKIINRFIYNKNYHIFETSWFLGIIIYNLSEDALITYTFPWIFTILLIGHAYYIKKLGRKLSNED